MPKKIVIETNKVYGRIPKSNNKLSKAKGIFFKDKEVFKIYNGNLVVYNKLPYIFNPLRTINIGAPGGNPDKYVREGDVDSHKEDKILGNIKVPFSSPDIISPNTSSTSKRGTFKLIQKISNLEISCNYIQQGNSSTVTYDNPIITGLSYEDINANGVYSGTESITVSFTQIKHTYNSSTDSVTATTENGVNTITKIIGRSIITGAGIKSGNIPYAANLKNTETIRKKVFEITKIYFIDLSGQEVTISGISYFIYQKENRKVINWGNYNINFDILTSLDIPREGGVARFNVEATSKGTPVYSSGYTDSSNIIDGEISADLTTTIGTLNRQVVMGSGNVELDIPKNNGKNTRSIIITAENRNLNVKEYLTLTQAGEASITNVNYSEPIIQNATSSDIKADGTDENGVLISFSQVKTTYYSDNTSSEEVLTRDSKASTMYGSCIIPDMDNIIISYNKLIGTNLTTNDTPRRIVYKATEFSFPGADGIHYRVKFDKDIWQEENKVIKTAYDNYIINLTSQKKSFGSIGGSALIEVNSNCSLTKTWTSKSYNSISVPTSCNLIITEGNKASLNKARVTGNDTVTLQVLSNELDTINKITVRATSVERPNLFKDISFDQSGITNKVEYSNPVLEDLIYSDILADGTGQKITAKYKITEKRIDSNGNVESIDTRYTSEVTKVSIQNKLSEDYGFNISTKKLYGASLSGKTTNRQVVINLSSISFWANGKEWTFNGLGEFPGDNTIFKVYQEANVSTYVSSDWKLELSSDKYSIPNLGGNCNIKAICWEKKNYSYTSGAIESTAVLKNCRLSINKISNSGDINDISLDSYTIGKEGNQSTILRVGRNSSNLRKFAVYGEIVDNPNITDSITFTQNSAEYTFDLINYPKSNLNSDDYGFELEVKSLRNNVELVNIGVNNVEISGDKPEAWVDSVEKNSNNNYIISIVTEDNTDSYEKTIRVLLTQPESGKTINFSIVQLGKSVPVDVSYSEPIIKNIGIPDDISANGSYNSGPIRVMYSQEKTITYSDGKKTKSNVEGETEIITATGNSLSDAPVTINNKSIFGTNLEKKIIDRRLVFTSTTITINSEYSKKNHTINYNNLNLWQEANRVKTNIDYTVGISIPEKYLPISGEGGEVIVNVISTKLTNETWTSGARNNSATPAMCDLSTSVGGFYPSYTDGGGLDTPRLTIPKNNNSSSRNITIKATVRENNSFYKNLVITQLAKPEVLKVTYETPIAKEISGEFNAAGTLIVSRKGLTVGFTQVKRTEYTNGGKETVETLTGYSVVESVSGNDIYNLNVFISNGFGSCNSLGTTDMNRRLIFNGNKVKFTSEFDRISYNVPCSSSFYQKENIVTKSTDFIEVDAIPNTNTIPYSGGSIKIKVIGRLRRTSTWSSGEDSTNISNLRCKASTDVGSLQPTTINCNDYTTLTVSKNPGANSRNINVNVWAENSIEDNKILTITQKSKPSINNYIYEIPEISIDMDMDFLANGTPKYKVNRYYVNYSQTRVIHYSDGSSEREELTGGLSDVTSISGTQENNGGVTLSGSTLSCRDLGKNITNRRKIYSGNSIGFTSEFDNTYYNVPCTFSYYQDKNGIKSKSEPTYKISRIYKSPNKTEINGDMDHIELSAQAVKESNVSYDSGFSEVESNSVQCSWSVDNGYLSKNTTNGTLNDNTVLTVDNNNSFTDKTIRVTAWPTDNMGVSSIAEFIQKPQNGYEESNPEIISCNVRDIHANGIGGSYIVNFAITTKRIVNGKVTSTTDSGNIAAISVKFSNSIGGLTYSQSTGFSANSLGTSPTPRRKIGTITSVTFMDNNRKTWNNISVNHLPSSQKDIYQEENKYTESSNKNYDIHMNFEGQSGITIGSNGGSLNITATGRISSGGTWTSGAKVNTNEVYGTVGFSTELLGVGNEGQQCSWCSFSPSSISNCNNKSTTLTIGPNPKGVPVMILVTARMYEYTQKECSFTFRQQG